jgi:hypothetical protein
MNDKELLDLRILADKLFCDIEDILEKVREIHNRSFEQSVKQGTEFMEQMLLGMGEKVSKVASNGRERLERLRKPKQS